MTAAQVNITQQDRSAVLASLSGISTATFINSAWGPLVGTVSNPEQLRRIYGEPVVSKGSSWLGAEILAQATDDLTLARVVPNNARHAAATVRWQVDRVDFNTVPNPGVLPDLAVNPLAAGIAMGQEDNFTFPLSNADRTFSDSSVSRLLSVSDDFMEWQVSSFGPANELAPGVTVAVVPSGTPTNGSAVFEISSIDTRSEVLNNVALTTLTSTTTIPAGTEVFFDDSGTPTSFSPAVTLVLDATSTSTLVVNNNDLISAGMTLTVGGQNVVVESKSQSSIDRSYLLFDSPAMTIGNQDIWVQLTGNTITRDAFLVYGRYVGQRGVNFKIGTRNSPNFDDAFFLDVYVDGSSTPSETFEVSRNRRLDGFGRQMFIEDRVNGVSEFIMIRNNEAISGDVLPVFTDNGVWRRDPTPIFSDSTSTTAEVLLQGDTEAKVSDTSVFVIGSRIKFSSDGPEYKVNATGVDVDSNPFITLDRGLVETRVESGVAILLFDPNNTDQPNGVYNGSQYYPFTSTPPLTGSRINDSLAISGNTGTVLDAGVNNLGGGSDGSVVSLEDTVAAANRINNRDEFDIQLFVDNGFAGISVAQRLEEIARSFNRAHAVNSVPESVERQSDAATAAIAYRESLNLNTEFSSLMSGYIRRLDVINQVRQYVAPSVFEAVSRSFVTRTDNSFIPAAGWVNGTVVGEDVLARYEQGDLNRLVDSQVNPIRFRRGRGLAIWGNETLLTRPSPLQLRSVNFLLIALKVGLEDYLDFELFRSNDPVQYQRGETAIDTFIRDNLSAGLVSWQVRIADVTTNTDRDNRVMNVFVGLQPTTDINIINANLAIFNNSIEITL